MLGCVKHLEAETQVCLEGVDFALHRSDLPMIIETDCVRLISAVLDTGTNRLSFFHSILEIRNLVTGNRVCKFVKLDRSQVRISHCLANWARAESKTQFWFGSGPDVVIQALASDTLVILTD